eukprot:6471414-Amphidinium_carterae.1
MGRLQAVPEEAWQELKALGFPVKGLQLQGKQLRDVYQAVELPFETWTGEDEEEVFEDVGMDDGWRLRLHKISTTPALCNCLRDMGFTHWRHDEQHMEFFSQHCFLPGAEDVHQTAWLSQKEERQILAQVSECYPSAAASSSAAALPEEEPAEDEAELDVQESGEYDSDEEDGPPTTAWQPSTKEKKAI